jgi:hypothetical protein
MEKVKFTLNEINEFIQTVESWDDSRLVPTSFREIRSTYVDFYYVVTVGEDKIKLPKTKGFWLDGNVELFPDKIIPGVSKVYVKEEDKVVLKTVDNVQVVNDFLEFDYLCETTNHNYTLENFLIHNYDIEDYVNSGWFGCTNVDKTRPECCDDWSDVFTTWRATRDAHLKSLKEWVLLTQQYKLPWSDVQAGLFDDWFDVYQELTEKGLSLDVAGMIFFNSWLCDGDPDKQTGLVPNGAEFPDLTPVENTSPDFPPGVSFGWLDLGATEKVADINYTGKTVFQESFLTDFETAQEEYSCALAKLIKIVYGADLSTGSSGQRAVLGLVQQGQNPAFGNVASRTSYQDTNVGLSGPTAIQHGLGTDNLIVKVWDNGGQLDVTKDCIITINDFNVINIDHTPGAISARVVIVGLESDNVTIESGLSGTDCGAPPPPLA